MWQIIIASGETHATSQPSIRPAPAKPAAGYVHVFPSAIWYRPPAAVIGDRVGIDLVSVRIDELEAERRAAACECVPELAERIFHGSGLVEQADDVEVVVGACLFVQERVDAPAAVDPDAKAASGEMSHEGGSAGGIHARLRDTSASRPRPLEFAHRPSVSEPDDRRQPVT